MASFPSTGAFIPDPSDTSGYNSDKIGIAWVTFDKNSGTSGKATPRIFVGVANKGSNNVFVSNDSGSTWTAVAGQNTTYLPHKGVISPSERVLYVSYSDGAGPYDGTLGSIYKYNISSSACKSVHHCHSSILVLTNVIIQGQTSLQFLVAIFTLALVVSQWTCNGLALLWSRLSTLGGLTDKSTVPRTVVLLGLLCGHGVITLK